MSARPTLQDIAKKTGVTKSTVSRALRSDPRIPAATRERVRQAAEAIGYRPDPLMAALSMRLHGRASSAQATTIAYVTKSRQIERQAGTGLRNLVREIYPKMCLNAAAARARELGYHLEHFDLNEKEMTNRRLSQILYSRGICGVCVGPLPRPRSHLKINWADFSCAAIGYTMLRPALHRTATHHYQGILLALRELRRLGYRRVGILMDEETSKRMDDLWLAGALVYSYWYPSNRPPILLHPYGYGESSRQTVISWFRKEQPDAVIGNIITKQWLEEEGIRFPKDAGFVTTNWFKEMGDVAGIDQRPDLIAAAAIDLIVAQIQRNERGIPPHPGILLTAGEWRPGGSVRQMSSAPQKIRAKRLANSRAKKTV